jgi:hypothetical protein
MPPVALVVLQILEVPVVPVALHHLQDQQQVLLVLNPAEAAVVVQATL